MYWQTFNYNSLAKKAPGGRSLDMIIHSGSFGSNVERVAGDGPGLL
jgi:hypothetical protein